MKKVLLVLLVLVLMISLAACGGNDGEGSSSSEEASNAASGQGEMQGAKVYGIGEAAEADGLSITIDKAEAAGSDIMLQKAGDGFTYMKVYYTFKNVSDETIETPSRKALYIVYEEGPTGDDSDMTSDDNSEVMLEVEDRDERYMSRVELAPGESTSGWMVYQRQENQPEVTMHYYSKFVNVPPTLVFGFKAP